MAQQSAQETTTIPRCYTTALVKSNLYWILIRPQHPEPNLKKVPGAYLRFIAETVRVRAFAGTDGGGVPPRSSLS